MKKLSEILGIETNPVSHSEYVISAIGGFVAIFFIILISQWVIDATAALMVVASMGASAVLLFVMPHAPLSQPWSVFGGHLISALIGVTCAKFISNDILAASLAVGLSIGAMYYLKCIHPPGGATALSAVIGGGSIQELGYQLLLIPVLLNVVIILGVAIIFNLLFSWRRYPMYLHQKLVQKPKALTPDTIPPISHEDFVYALSEIDSFVDINEHDLIRIYNIATKKSLD